MEIAIERNDDHSRYELTADGRLASFAEFRDDGSRIVFPHTVTLPEFRGQGLAGQVVRRALDDARASGRAVVPLCWFVAGFIDEHPEYHDLVAA